MQSQSLTVQGQQSLASIDPMADWQLMRQQADVLKASGFLPQAIKSAEAAMAIILIGRELNIPMMTALNNINVIQGKITIPPQLMMALINRTGELEDLKVSDENNAATVTMKRKGRASHTESFSMADAAKMLLDQKDNWRKQPRTMRKWRAIAACARIVFPDVITGLYIPEEMGAHVNDDGEIDLAMAEHVEEKPAAKTPRAALKAVPKAAPAIEAEPIIDKTYENLEAAGFVSTPTYDLDKVPVVTEPEEDDPLPEFAEREQEETPEEIEADRQELIAAIKVITLQFRTESEFEQWMVDSDAGNQTRGWLRTILEKAQAKVLKTAEATALVAITNPKDAPAQLPDGRQKEARQDESGTEFATYVHPNDAAPGPYKLAYDRFHSIFEEWRAKGQDYGTVRDKVEASVHNKRFKNFGELDAADLARATHALYNWNPEADASLAKKGAKK